MPSIGCDFLIRAAQIFAVPRGNVVVGDRARDVDPIPSMSPGGSGFTPTTTRSTIPLDI
jgi:hypothetical protein